MIAGLVPIFFLGERITIQRDQGSVDPDCGSEGRQNVGILAMTTCRRERVGLVSNRSLADLTRYTRLVRISRTFSISSSFRQFGCIAAILLLVAVHNAHVPMRPINQPRSGYDAELNKLAVLRHGIQPLGMPAKCGTGAGTEQGGAAACVGEQE